MKQKPFASIILIALGLFFLLSRLTGFEALQHSFVLILGLGFLFYGFRVKEPGFFIPAGILLGIGLGIIAMSVLESRNPDGDFQGAFLVCFALGWFSIPVLSGIYRQRVLWPLIPGVIIGFVGVSLLTGGVLMTILGYTDFIWPLGLIGLGLWLWFKPRKKDDPSEKE